ncbi:hypothetical protein DFH09DRAFT_1088978 [Mycena vulgaris]|nr:hypothetical protein DFH09DRAFT_1088978 [Mycena vulgaris]
MALGALPAIIVMLEILLPDARRLEGIGENISQEKMCAQLEREYRVNLSAKAIAGAPPFAPIRSGDTAGVRGDYVAIVPILRTQGQCRRGRVWTCPSPPLQVHHAKIAARTAKDVARGHIAVDDVQVKEHVVETLCER